MWSALRPMITFMFIISYIAAREQIVVLPFSTLMIIVVKSSVTSFWLVLSFATCWWILNFVSEALSRSRSIMSLTSKRFSLPNVRHRTLSGISWRDVKVYSDGSIYENLIILTLNVGMKILLIYFKFAPCCNLC